MATARTDDRTSWPARVLAGALFVVVGTVVVSLVIAVLMTTVLRGFGGESAWQAYVVALAPWCIPGTAILLLAALAWRRWVAVVAAAALLAVHVVWQWPVLVPGGTAAPDAAASLTVTSANLLIGGVDATAVVDLVRRENTDVLSIQELTPAAVTALEAAGLQRLLPYRQTVALPGPAGSGAWSKWPLGEPTVVPGTGFVNLLTTVAYPGGRFTLAVAHPVTPGIGSSRSWMGDHERLRRALSDTPGPVVLAGDLNATRDHRVVMRLIDDGFVDSAAQAGIGATMTFPVGRLGPLPPVVRIDHVFVRDAPWRGVHVDVSDLPRGDHRAVTVRLAVPATGG